MLYLTLHGYFVLKVLEFKIQRFPDFWKCTGYSKFGTKKCAMCDGFSVPTALHFLQCTVYIYMLALPRHVGCHLYYSPSAWTSRPIVSPVTGHHFSLEKTICGNRPFIFAICPPPPLTQNPGCSLSHCYMIMYSACVPKKLSLHSPTAFFVSTSKLIIVAFCR